MNAVPRTYVPFDDADVTGVVEGDWYDLDATCAVGLTSQEAADLAAVAAEIRRACQRHTGAKRALAVAVLTEAIEGAA